MAHHLGLSPAMLTRWFAGTGKPAKPHRERMRSLYGIPVEAWDETKDEFAPIPAEWQTQLAAAEEQLARELTSTNVREIAVVGGTEGVLVKARQLESMCCNMMKDIEGVSSTTPSEKARIMSSIAGTLNVLSRLTGDYDSGKHFLKLPIWHRIVEELRTALTPFPEAAKAVAEKFDRLATEFDK